MDSTNKNLNNNETILNDLIEAVNKMDKNKTYKNDSNIKNSTNHKISSCKTKLLDDIDLVLAYLKPIIDALD